MRLLLTIGLGCLMVLPSVAQKQSHWHLFTFYSYEVLNQQRPAWHVWQLGLQRRLTRQTVIADVTVHQRFNRRDIAWALESWSTLWSKAYGNLRLQYAPTPRFLPAAEVYLELYQGLEAWEVAFSVRSRFFSDDTVPTLGLALARYEANWYLRARTVLTPLAGRLNWAQTFMARHYWRPPQEFIDLQVGIGRGVEIIDVGPVLQAVRTYFVAIRLQRFLRPSLGISVGLTYSNDDLFTRRGILLGLLQRW